MEGDISTNYSDIPEPMQSWMEEEKDITNYTKTANLEQTYRVQLEWDDILGDGPNPDDPNYCSNDTFYQKGPITFTEWDQWSGYNNLVNSGGCTLNFFNAGKPPTGCIATSMAQIMRYWQKPNTYNWNNMPNGFGTVDTQILMRDIGNGWINYGCDASSQQSDNIPGRFANLGFNATYTDNYNPDLIKQQLQWNRPVILSGGRKKDGISWNMYADGHAWVCDGYQDFAIKVKDDQNNCLTFYYLYFRMNWGWGGRANGWFNAHNFNPVTVGNNGNVQHSFNFKRGIVYNITPN